MSTILTQRNPETLNVEEPAAAYSGKITELEGLYKTDTFNPITEELEEVYNGILNLLMGNANHFNLVKREAAHLLQRDLEKYGSGFVKENYNAETIDLENIINDWRTKPELISALNVLGILDWITELDRFKQIV